jgi:hypothetical protein
LVLLIKVGDGDADGRQFRAHRRRRADLPVEEHTVARVVAGLDRVRDDSDAAAEQFGTTARHAARAVAVAGQYRGDWELAAPHPAGIDAGQLRKDDRLCCFDSGSRLRRT